METRRIRVGTREMGAGMLGMQGIQEIRVGMRGMGVRMREIRVRMRGIRVGMREMGVGMLGMRGMQGIRVGMREMGVGMRGVRVRMRGTRVGMPGIRMGMAGIRVGMRGIGVGMRGIEWNRNRKKKTEKKFLKLNLRNIKPRSQGLKLSYSRNDPNKRYYFNGMWTCGLPVMILNFLSSNEKVRLHFTQGC